MNVIGELAFIVGLTAIAGIIIGWCLRSFSGGSAKQARLSAARDADSAVRDARHLRLSLDDREKEIHNLKNQLKQEHIGKDRSTDSGNRAQVAEINELKKDLANSKKTLLNNQAEFNNYRTKTKKEHSELQKELTKFKSGGSANSERLAEAGETVAALRSAVRENDKVIESLRARVKEADSTVENLRSQLKSSESGRNNLDTVTLEYDKKIELLSKDLEQNKATVEKQKRDYDLMLENKNKDIKNLQSRIEETTTASSSIKAREHDFKKQSVQYKEEQNKFQTEIKDLKSVIAERDTALSKARNKISDLNTQITLVKQHEVKEVEKLRAKVDDGEAVRAKIQNKNAEVAALNEMLKDSSKKRDALQADLDKLRNTTTQKDTRITSLQSELDEVVASRNKVSTQLGELQSKGNIALDKLQQDFNHLAKTRDAYKARIDSLQKEVSDLKNSKLEHESELKQTTRQLTSKNQTLQSETKVLQHEVRTLDKKRAEYKSTIDGLQLQLSNLSESKDSHLRQLKAQLTTQSQETEKKLQSANKDLSDKNAKLESDLNTLQSKLRDHHRSIEQYKSDIATQTEANQRLTAKLNDSEKQVSEFRTRLMREESESQRLNSELLDAETLRLTLTDRDAELRKLQIDLQEANNSGAAQSIIDEQSRKNDSLMAALRERDEEINRLNTQMTNNRLRSKEQQSNINLLTEEKEAQAKLVKSLEVQAENTLHLHTKIAQQSTELEELRAKLYEHATPTTSHTTTSQTAQGISQTRSSGLQQIETNHAWSNTSQTNGQTADSKPRVFVRSDAEALTGASGYQTAQRPQFTLDGHRIRRPDGSDDLSLLPGVTSTIAGALGRQGISEFEQIAQWTDREVAHYAEHIGVSVQRAKQYNWPKAARSIISGSYRKDGQEIGN